MACNEKGSKLLSDTLVWMKYAKNIGGRRETWDENVDRVEGMYVEKYPYLEKDIRWSFQFVRQRRILPSMRSLQFAGPAMKKHESRGYNCAYAPLSDVLVFSELFFNLLCGTGVGFSVEEQFISKIPKLHRVDESQKEIYVIQDSIEGWADACHFLMTRFVEGGADVEFDPSLIRAKGVPLKTSGGYAPGPEPIMKALRLVREILLRASGRHLRSIEAYDIMCHLADAVYAGGIRRAAMICFFDRFDKEMMEAKKGAFYEENPQRVRSNNSAVLPRKEVMYDEFMEIMETIENNHTGDPGVLWVYSFLQRFNPCVEASLDPHSFCNLATIDMSSVRSMKDFLLLCKAIAIIGTLQASMTNFSYLSERWRKATENSALLGVSMTGLASNTVEKLNLDLSYGASVIRDINIEFAKKMNINPAHRLTLIKPEGTTSLVLGTSSGTNQYHAPFYLRGIEIEKAEPIYEALMEIMPSNIEPLLRDPVNYVMAYFPMKAPEGALTRHSEGPLELLERTKKYTKEWIFPGHMQGENPHNASITVNIKDDEWKDVSQWMWENRDFYSGIATFPYYGGTHPQTPFVEVDEETYLLYLSRIHGELDPINIKEEFRLSAVEETVSCVGNSCEYI